MASGRKRRVLIAPDSFKGTLSAVEVCRIIRAAFLEADASVDVRCCPMADGGEGTVDAFLHAKQGERRYARVHGPLFSVLDAPFGLLEDGTAVIEMAAASGLPLAGSNKNPLYTSTFGTGELIRAALDAGCGRILLGAGGSATNDGGIGCLTALGVRFLDAGGNEVPPMGCGLAQITRIDPDGLDKRLQGVEVAVLSDVVSPLCGPLGAAFVFAAQKGASGAQVQELDRALRSFAEIALRDTGWDIRSLPGAGAAGGLAGGLYALLGAQIRSGVEALLQAVDFDALVAQSDLVVTGEGRMDAQSGQGKAPWGVAQRAAGKPVIAIVGGLGGNGEQLAAELGFAEIYEANDRGRPVHEIAAHCRADLREAALRAAAAFFRGDFERPEK